jgi:hypothetical protein
MAIKQEVNAPLIVTIGVVSGLLLLVTVFGVQAWFVLEENKEFAQKWELSKNEQLDELRAIQRANIERTGWVESQDKKKAFVLPIEQAKQILVQTGGKVPTTQPK